MTQCVALISMLQSLMDISFLNIHLHAGTEKQKKRNRSASQMDEVSTCTIAHLLNSKLKATPNPFVIMFQYNFPTIE